MNRCVDYQYVCIAIRMHGCGGTDATSDGVRCLPAESCLRERSTMGSLGRVQVIGNIWDQCPHSNEEVDLALIVQMIVMIGTHRSTRLQQLKRSTNVPSRPHHL